MEGAEIEKQKQLRKSKIRIISTIIFLPIIIPICIIGWTLMQMSESKQSIKIANYKERNYVTQKTIQEKQLTIFKETKIENEPIAA